MSDNQYKLEIQKLLQEIQEKADVHMLNYNGIDYWPILRTQIAFRIIHNQEHFKKIKNKKNENILFKIFRHLYQLTKTELSIFFKDRKATTFFYKKADIFYLTHSRCRQIHKGAMTDIYFGPICQWIKENDRNISIFAEEYFPSGEIRLPRKEKTKPLENVLFFYRLKLEIIKKIYIKNNLKNDFELNKINEILEKYNYKTINKKQLQNLLSHIHLLSKRYEKILRKTNPKIVMLINYYNVVGYALIQAANKSGIKTFDIQHGVQGELHPAYMALPTNKQNGWSCLPKYFLCWNNISSNHINSWGGEHHKAITLGNVWHDFLLEPHNKGNNSKYIEKIESKIKNKANIVLFTLQPIHDADKISDLIINLANDEKLKDFFWLIRLHPGMLQEEHAWIERLKPFKNIDITNASRANLVYLLNVCDIHITKYSSVTIEAIAFNKKTLLIDPDERYYNDLNNTGLIYKRKWKESLGDAIKRTMDGENIKYKNTTTSSKEVFLKLLNYHLN